MSLSFGESFSHSLLSHIISRKYFSICWALSVVGAWAKYTIMLECRKLTIL
jgi:hypothetical protein